MPTCECVHVCERVHVCECVHVCDIVACDPETKPASPCNNITTMQ